MGGGSKSPESPSEQQCIHCGLWYSDRGIKAHEQNCDLEGFDVVLNEIEDGHPMHGGAPDDGESPDTPDPDAVEGDTPTTDGADPSEAVTDGSGLGLSGPPSGDVDVDVEETDAADADPGTVDCPNCGADLKATPDEVAAADTPACGECGHAIRVIDE